MKIEARLGLVQHASCDAASQENRTVLPCLPLALLVHERAFLKYQTEAKKCYAYVLLAFTEDGPFLALNISVLLRSLNPAQDQLVHAAGLYTQQHTACIWGRLWACVSSLRAAEEIGRRKENVRVFVCHLCSIVCLQSCLQPGYRTRSHATRTWHEMLEAHLRGVGYEHTDDARPRSHRRSANAPHSAEITQCLKLGRLWEHGRKVKDSLRIAERQAAGAAALNPMEVEDVTTWLCDTVRLPEYSELFSKYQIGGPRLAKITEPELVRLGVRRSFHAKLICLHRDELGFQRHGALRPSSFRDDHRLVDASPGRRIAW